MKKPTLYAILSGIFCACLIVSNILAFKTFDFFSLTLPAAVIVFPVVYITNDMLAELYGFKRTRIVIVTGFAINLMAVAAYTIAIMLPEAQYFAGQTEFKTVLSNSPRVLAASMAAYIVGSLTNAKVMERMKLNSTLFTRCVLSTLFGEGLDAIIFISIAFFGTMPVGSLAVMIVSQAMFKTIYEIIMFPVTKRLIKAAKEF